MKRFALLLVGAFAFSVACQDRPDLMGPDVSLDAILDGSSGGNPHFYFLPPLAGEPGAMGDFDAGVAAEVVICEWTGSGCGATVAEFDTEGQGSESVRADGSEGHYIVNWHTRRSSLEPDQVYRITVSGEGVELGYVDVYAVGNGRDLRAVDDAEYFPLLIGRTVPIKFRIEVGAFEVPTARVVGTITDVAGAGLAGVHASLEGTAVVGTSNNLGGLTLEGVRTGQTSVLRLTLAGYADQLVQIAIPDGVERVTFRTSMLQRAAPVTVSATAGGTATSTDGASVVLPPSSLVDADGNAVSGDVDVTVTPVDVSGDGIEAFPGSFTGINSDGEPGLILTYGVSEYTFTQNGQELNLAPGETATIRIPVYSGAAGLSAGDELPLWFLDEATGDWIEEGSGTVVADPASPTGLAVEGDVTHFSWWNIDVWTEDPYEPWVRCIVDGAPTDCTIYATVDDPSFPRSSATEFLSAEGKRLTFPASPVVTELLGQANNRYGTVPGGVSGPSGGGAGDTVVVDLTEEGVVHGDHSVVTLSTDTVEIPGTVVLTLEARDSTGAPVTTGGAIVRFWILRDGGGGFIFPAEDNGDGTYTYEHTPGEGTFTVRGEVNGTFVATGDPMFTAIFSATAGRGSTSLVSVSPTSVPQGGTATITLQAHDSAGVAKTTGGDSVTFRVGSGALVARGTTGPVTDNGDGTYTATFTGTNAGAPVEILSTINFEPVTTGNPTVAVSPGVLTEAGADSALAEAFLAWWRAAHGFHVEWTLSTMADAPSSSWLNADMGVMSAEPRPAWNNDPD